MTYKLTNPPTNPQNHTKTELVDGLCHQKNQKLKKKSRKNQNKILLFMGVRKLKGRIWSRVYENYRDQNIKGRKINRDKVRRGAQKVCSSF